MFTDHHFTQTPKTLHLCAGEYHLARGGELRAARGTVSPFAREVNAAFRARILAPEFSCVAAKASMNTSTYALGCYAELGTEEATAALSVDLARFCADQDAMESDFTSFLAVFRAPDGMDERAFEERLWGQLRALHAADTAPYSPEVSADPTDPKFGFSFAGRGFFVIGLHPGSSRVARAFPYPALVFNAHRQFQGLRDSGRFDRMQQTIRSRELKLQGSLNPNLANHGEAPEARQYSGRAVEPGWVAPFPAAARAGKCPFGHG